MQCNEPMKIRSNHMFPAPSAGKCARANHDWFWVCFWLVEKVLCEVKPKQTLITFDNLLKTFCLLSNRSVEAVYSLLIVLVFRADDSSPPVSRHRSSSSRSADDVCDSHVTNGSNRLSADLDNYAQVGLGISVSLLLQGQQRARLLCSIL